MDVPQVARRAWSKHESDPDKKAPMPEEGGDDPCGSHPFVLVGLHTCGDLGPSIVQLFAKATTARALVSVGCCYMKLSCTQYQSGKAVAGYPMSRHVARLGERAQLSYQAREVACHAFEAYVCKLRGGLFLPLSWKAYRIG